MTQAGATLAAAGFALTGALVAAAVALYNESNRRRDVRQADELKELRSWTSRVFEQLFVLQHETEWLTWHALEHPSTVNTQMVGQYEAAVHTAYPKALGATAVVAAMDSELSVRLRQLADEFYRFENRVAVVALSVLDASNDKAINRLAAMNEESREFYVRLPNELAEAMAAAKVQPLA